MIMKKVVSSLIFVLFAVAILNAAESKKSAKDYMADLDSGKDEIKIVEAARWAGEKQEKPAVSSLIVLLKDKRENVRIEAGIALGLIGEESAVEELNKSMLNDESANVRYASLLATFRIGSKKSLESWKKARATETDPIIKDFLKKMEEKAKK